MTKAFNNFSLISDLTLWALLFILGTSLLYYCAVYRPNQRTQTIHLKFHDVNEISKGSSVRAMGTDIGYVSNVQLKNDYADVTIKTYPDMMRIPEGSIFTILFTGLGGAKSIEVRLPQEKKAGRIDCEKHPCFIAEEPIRMRDTTEAWLRSTKALQNGAETTAEFLGDSNSQEALPENIFRFNTTISKAIRSIDHTKLALSQHNFTLLPPRKGSQQLFPRLNELQAVLYPNQIGQDLKQTQLLWRQCAAYATQLQSDSPLFSRPAQWSQLQAGLSWQVALTNSNLDALLGNWSEKTRKTMESLETASSRAGSSDVKQQMDRAHEKISELNQWSKSAL
ncbi:MAG: MCE family protein [Cyanobacteria bacterium P01_H01_bin.74]